jgi:endoribonuclease Dicer
MQDFNTFDSSLLLLEDMEEGATVPRSYQMEMFHKAMAGNVIAVLDTGSGKTLISCLIIKHVHNIDFENKASRISVFVLTV